MKERALGPAVAVLVLVACGGDGDGSDIVGSATTTEADTPADDSGDADAYIRSVAASLADDEGIPLDEELAMCTATALVEVIGVDNLTIAGVVPEELADAGSLDELDVEPPDDAATALAGGFAQCDMGGLIVNAVAESFSVDMGGESLPSDAIACLEENIDDQAAADALAASFVDGADEDANTLFSDAVAACPDVMTAIIVAEASAPVAPADEDCIRDVIEENRDLVRASVNGDATATQELGTLTAETCPNVTG